jgi:hypothetical protein
MAGRLHWGPASARHLGPAPGLLTGQNLRLARWSACRAEDAPAAGLFIWMLGRCRMPTARRGGEPAQRAR